MKAEVKHHFLLYPFFKRFIQWKIKQNFQGIKLIGNCTEKGTAVLVISNHVSWWDGFWINHLNQEIFHRKFSFLMREDQLQKHWYFKFTGGIPIKKGSRSVIDNLHYCIKLLSKPEYLLLVFPQGKIHSMHSTTFTFGKGIDYIINHLDSAVQIIFVANLLEYFSHPKPTVYMHFEEFEFHQQELTAIQNAYQQFFTRAIEKQKKLSN